MAYKYVRGPYFDSEYLENEIQLTDPRETLIATNTQYYDNLTLIGFLQVQDLSFVTNEGTVSSGTIKDQGTLYVTGGSAVNITVEEGGWLGMTIDDAHVDHVKFSVSAASATESLNFSYQDTGAVADLVLPSFAGLAVEGTIARTADWGVDIENENNFRVQNITVNGRLEIDGVVADDISVLSGGGLLIHAGTAVNDLSISYGGNAFIKNDVASSVVFTGNLRVAGSLHLHNFQYATPESAATVSGALIFDLAGRSPSDTSVMVDSLDSLVCNAFAISVSADQADGTYLLAENASSFAQSITVQQDGKDLGTVSCDTSLTVNHTSYRLFQRDGGLFVAIQNVAALPDLVVETLYVTSESGNSVITENDTAVCHFTVKNQGAAASIATKIAIRDQRISIAPLAAGGSCDYQYVIGKHSRGYVRLYWDLDPDNIVAESDETNNGDEICFTIVPSNSTALPDLFVENFYVTSESGSTVITENDTAVCHFTVKNQGTVASIATEIAIRDQRISIAPLAAGTSCDYQYVIGKHSRGYVRLYCDLDPDNIVAESDETNNRDPGDVCFTIVPSNSTALPDLFVENFYVTSESGSTVITENDTAVFHFTVKNQGTAASIATEIAIRDQRISIAPLAAGGSCDYEYVIGKHSRGYVRLYWDLDPDNIVAESDETNNGDEICFTIVPYASSSVPVPIFSGTNAIEWTAVSGTAEYLVQYSTDSFVHALTLSTEQTKLETCGLPQGEWQWRVRTMESDEWQYGDTISKTTSHTTPESVSALEDGINDILFLSSQGIWTGKYVAQHLGCGSWSGTMERVRLAGKNRFSDTITANTDINLLVLTDDANGDALFVDDIYTEFPDEQQARIAQIDEIRAGAGDDIVDMTSQRFEYVGDGVVIRGGSGNDTIWANKGENLLFGDAGNDRIVGASGNDVLAGGSGDDSLHGGGGNDLFCFCKNWGKDTVEQISGGSVTLWFASGSEECWDPSSMTYTAGANSVKVTGVSEVTLKFGDDGSSQYDELVSSGCFLAESSKRVFEDSATGVLAVM